MRRVFVVLTVVVAALFGFTATAVAAPSGTTSAAPAWVAEVTPGGSEFCALGAFMTNVGNAPGRARVDLWYGSTKDKLTGPPKSTFGPVRVNAGNGAGYFFDVPDGKLWRVRFTGTAVGGGSPKFVENQYGRLNQPGCTFAG